MIQNDPLMIAVAPNGARKTQRDHPALPITPQELAYTAASCLDAGACMLHLHVRDENRRHSLDASRYREAIQSIRREVGDELIVQITTEAVGLYDREQQMQVVRELRPEAVSLAVREISPAGCDEALSAEFFAFLRRERIAGQYILYDEADILHFSDLLTRGIITDDRPSVLLVLGRYAENQQSDPADIPALLEVLPAVENWSLCAFGASEAECMFAAIRLGGHCRVGFENNMVRADSSMAENNAAQVSEIRSGAESLDREIATPSVARKLLGMS